MDKTRKLRRYNRKDYTQVVDFPVEIVGRDGVVRRYSFEESIRLYQRRIASAAARYGDEDVAHAEMEHCQRRIDQLRRSYLERYGGTAVRRIQELDGLPGLAGEVTAFLRRCVDPEQALDRLAIEPVGSLDQGRVYSVRLDADAPALILYIYAFESPGPCPARDAFFGQVKLLQQLRRGGEGLESLVAFHHTADVGLVLTGMGEPARELAERAEQPEGEGWEIEEEPQEALHHEALVRMRRGDAEGALRAFERAYEQDHFRRSAYLGAAVVADQLGRFEHAALAAEMGSRYFPDDPSMAWHLAVAHLRRGDVAASREALARAHAFEADDHAVSLLRALIALRSGQVRAGLRLLQSAARQDDGSDPSLARTRMRLRLSLGALGSVRAISLVGSAACLAGAARGEPLPSVVAVAGLLTSLVAGPAWRLWLRRLVSRPGRTGIGLSSVATLTAAARRSHTAQ